MARLTRDELTAARGLVDNQRGDPAAMSDLASSLLDHIDEVEAESEQRRVEAVTTRGQLSDANVAITQQARAARKNALRHVLNHVIDDERNAARQRAIRGRGDPDFDAEKRALDRLVDRLNALLSTWDSSELPE